MKRILITSTALVVGMAVQAQAQPSSFVEAVIEAFTREGYSEIEVSAEGDRVFVEAVRDGTEFETVYDLNTGAVISHEVHEDDDEDDEDEDVEDEDDEDDDEDDDDEDDEDEDEDDEDEDDEDEDDDEDDEDEDEDDGEDDEDEDDDDEDEDDDEDDDEGEEG